MRERAAIRTFRLSTLWVGVHPMRLPARFTELVDLRLVDVFPIAHGQFRADKRLVNRQGKSSQCCGITLLNSAQAMSPSSNPRGL
jgi:hypothetical protein